MTNPKTGPKPGARPSAAPRSATLIPPESALPVLELPATPPPGLVREPWYRAIFTDRYGEFDTGRVLVAITILAMLYLEWLDVDAGSDFDAQKLGTGIGAVLAGFAAYLYGDARSAPQPGTTTLSINKRITQTDATAET